MSTEASAGAKHPEAGFWSVFRVSSGNFLEMYDFMVFGYYAEAIGATFFPSGDKVTQLLLAFMTFGAGFLMRPLGAVILGAYADKHGRRAGLLLTLTLMAVGVVSLALTPGYRTIGVAAPLIVLAGRLLQGFSAGMELGGVSVYLSEIAPPGRKGFYVAWQSASQQVAVMVAAIIGLTLNHLLGKGEMNAWGWRIPLLIGCLIAPALFLMRRHMQETEAFSKQAHRPELAEVWRSLLTHARIVGVGLMLVTMTTVSFYMITAYTPTFGTAVLKLSPTAAFTVTMCVGLSNLILLPVMGAASDRVGRKPLLYACTLLMLVTAYPAMRWLVGAPSFGRLLTVELWLSVLYASYNGAMVVFLTEMIPVKLRAAGFSLAYSLAAALFGGFSPAIATWLIKHTGDKAMPGAWLSFAAVVGLVAAFLARAHEADAPYLPRIAAGGGPLAEERAVEGASGLQVSRAFSRDANKIGQRAWLAPSTIRSSLRSADGPPPAASRGRYSTPPPPCSPRTSEPVRPRRSVWPWSTAG